MAKIKALKMVIRRKAQTGILKKRRLVKGSLYFNKKWLGKKVFIIPFEDYLQSLRELRKNKIKLVQIMRIIKRKI